MLTRAKNKSISTSYLYYSTVRNVWAQTVQSLQFSTHRTLIVIPSPLLSIAPSTTKNSIAWSTTKNWTVDGDGIVNGQAKEPSCKMVADWLMELHNNIPETIGINARKKEVSKWF